MDPRTVVFVWLMAMHSLALAQVYRCADSSTGRVVYSDTPCVEGRQIVRRLSDEEKLLEAERVELARQRAQLSAERAAIRQQQLDAGVQQAAPTHPSVSRECEIAQKNAWGANKVQKQKEADIICYGSEAAARIRAAEVANKPLRTTCMQNGKVTNCISR